MRFLADVRYSICRDRLIRRREVVVRTLGLLGAEQKLVDANQQWNDPSTQRNRISLLAKIHGWYDLELKKIDAILGRLSHTSTRSVK